MQQTQDGLFSGFLPQAVETVSKKGFAEMIGVSPGRVSQMIEAGLPVEPNGRISVKKGSAWVDANIDSNRRRAVVPGDAGAPQPRTARAQRDAAEAVIAQLKAEKLAGNLVDRRMALRVVESRARLERDSWIAWCNRAAPALATATNADIAIVIAELDRLVREQLASLAEVRIERLDA